MTRAKPLLWPLVVALLVLAVTAGLWIREGRTQHQQLARQFDYGVRQTAARIAERVANHEQMLRGLRGLFDASDEVTAADFAHYVDALLNGPDVAGIRGLAWVAWRDGRAVVDYIAPAPDAPLLEPGADLMTAPAVAGALQAARDSGTVAMSERLRVDDDLTAGTGSAFVVCLAIYRPGLARETPAQRRAAASGWVCASFRAADLMSSLYGEGTPGLAIHLHDGTAAGEASHMFGPESAGPPALLRAQEYLGVAGRSWTLVAESTPELVSRHGSDARQFVAVGGIGLALALALLTWQLVTARDRATAAARAMTGELEASAERYRRIVETAHEGIWAVGADGRTTFANPGLLQMLGCRREDLLGHPWTEPMDDPSRAAMAGEALEQLRRGEAVRRDLRLRRGDGGELWAAASISPDLDAGGHLVGWLAMLSDMTERRRADLERAQLEDQLRQSQKMEAIGTLAGGIAHDFNNLLAAILGSTSMLRDDLGDGHRLLPQLEQIERAATRGRSLVQQIVTFSRQQPSHRQVLALRPVVEESARLLRATLPARVALELELADEPLHVDADPTQLQQVLLNLCTNAWHAIGDARGRIVVGLARADLPGRRGGAARLWVADDGCGMDAATRERIFEPFFTTKPVGHGTGLGLSVVHGIVAGHGGTIEVDSAPGRGTRFDLLLPLAESAPEAVAAPSSAVGDPGPPARGRGEHVLYVDDDPLMCLVVEALLARAGYRVTTLEDPRRALAAATSAEDPVALVVTDFNMPTMSGLELARALHDARPALPIIMTSGYVNEGLPAQALEVGVRVVLQKEFTLEQIVPLVAQALEGGVQTG